MMTKKLSVTRGCDLFSAVTLIVISLGQSFAVILRENMLHLI